LSSRTAAPPRACVDGERRAWAALGQHRSTEQVRRGRDDEERVTSLPSNTAATAIARSQGLLGQAGWIINEKRVERIWRRASKRC
jgi:putative transposase